MTNNSSPEPTVTNSSFGPLGTFYYNDQGQLHREDGPAVKLENGTKEWWLNGLSHREDGPARIYPDGTKLWMQNGKMHREDGPAWEWPNGCKMWYNQGIFERWSFE